MPRSALKTSFLEKNIMHFVSLFIFYKSHAFYKKVNSHNKMNIINGITINGLHFYSFIFFSFYFALFYIKIYFVYIYEIYKIRFHQIDN